MEPYIQFRNCPVPIWQHKDELRQFMKWLSYRRIRTILEIGVNNGGSAWCWMQCAETGFVYVGVDTELKSEVVLTLKEEAGKGHGLAWFTVGDSHTARTRIEAENHMVQPYDFIFVDGDHSYRGALQDVWWAMSLLNTDGVLAMHDIWREGECGQVWQEVSSIRSWWSDVQVFSDRPGYEWFGIGALVKR